MNAYRRNLYICPFVHLSVYPSKTTVWSLLKFDIVGQTLNVFGIFNMHSAFLDCTVRSKLIPVK